MTVQELKATLAGAGVKERAYDLDGSNRDEVYCLDQAPRGWAVYYRERGIRRDERLFASEDEACRYILDLITEDPTTRL